jgi:hypothetical protein
MVTIAPVGTGPFTKTWNITSSADTDVAAQFAHGFLNHYTPVAPAVVLLTPLKSQAFLHEWVLGVVDTTNINLAAVSATGAGLAGTPQLQVVAMLPQSVMD